MRGDFAFGLGLMWVSAVLFISGMAFSTTVSFVTESLREELLASRVFVHQRRILFLVREYRAVRDNRRSRGEDEFGHFRDSDDDVDVNQSFISKISKEVVKLGGFARFGLRVVRVGVGGEFGIKLRGGVSRWIHKLGRFYGLTSGVVLG